MFGLERLFQPARSAIDLSTPSVSAARQILATTDKNKSQRDWAVANAILAEQLVQAHWNGETIDIEEIIECWEASLTFFTPMSDLAGWASASGHLAWAYSTRGDCTDPDNMDKAISIQKSVVDRISPGEFRSYWLSGMWHLAGWHLDRTYDFNSDDTEYAIIYAEEALVVAQAHNEPEIRAGLLETLADALSRRPRGDRLDNLKRSLSAYDEALFLQKKFADLTAIARIAFKHDPIYIEKRSLTNDSKGSNHPDNRTPEEERIVSEVYFRNLESKANAISKTENPGAWASAQFSIADSLVSYGMKSNDGNSYSKSMIANCSKAISRYQAVFSEISDNSSDQAAYILARMSSIYSVMFLMSEADDIGWNDFSQIHQLNADYRSDRTKECLNKATLLSEKALKIRRCRNRHAICFELECQLGQYLIWQRNWKEALEYFENASTTFRHLLAESKENTKDLTGLLKTLSGLANLAPFSAMMIGDSVKALSLTELSRAHLLAKALTIRALSLPEEASVRLVDLTSQIAEQEHLLLSPTTFNRRSPLEETINLRKEFGTILGTLDWHTTTDFDVENAISTLLMAGHLIVLPVLCEYGGFLLLYHDVGNPLNALVIKVSDKISLRSTFSKEGRIKKEKVIVSTKTRNNKYTKRRWLEALHHAQDTVTETVVTPLSLALEETQANKESKILILIQEGLARVPIGSASMGRHSEAMIDHFQVSYTPSLRLAMSLLDSELSRDSRFEDIAILSGANYEDDNDDLEFAPIEGDIVESWFSNAGVTRFSGAHETQEHILKTLDGMDIWHICAHGRISASDPLSSEIDLGYATVPIKALFDIRLLKPPKLVVLSACETGLHGEDDLANEFLGMPTAFLQLGAQGVIATQWPVDDLATTFLMGRMYEYLFNENRTPASALRMAQLWLREVTVEKLHEIARRWVEAGRLTHNNQRQLLQNLPRIEDEAARKPFTSVEFWGAFTYYGI